MKNRILRIIIIISIVSVVWVANKGWEKLLRNPNVQAFGDLLVNFHVVNPGDPIFTLVNMKPGDNEFRPIDVTNSGPVSRFILVKGNKTGGVGADPKLESILQVSIKDGSDLIYGPVTMADFFNQSLGVDGVPLNIITSGEAKTYNFFVDFPSSAENEFQAKSVIAGITFGVRIGDNVVINEVFFNVNTPHGKGQSFQWVELYNPTNQDVSLKNWTITDNTGNAVIIHANKIIKADGFALLSKDAAVWRYWDEERGAIKVELGKNFGNGLDLSDKLLLNNNLGDPVDEISWGEDISAFNPAIPAAVSGHSSERLAPGFDNDLASDFINHPPSPGN